MLLAYKIKTGTMLSFEDFIYHFTVEYEERLHDYKKIAP